MVIHHIEKDVQWIFVRTAAPKRVFYINWLQAVYLRQLIGLLTSVGISESKAYADRKNS
jgi:hypothetical protein